MSTIHGISTDGTNNYRLQETNASHVDIGIGTDLETYVASQKSNLLTQYDNALYSVGRGSQAVVDALDNGDILMALTTEESADFRAGMNNMSELTQVCRNLLDIWRNNGVGSTSTSWDVLKAELQAFASNASNISSGVLGIAYGGTGRTDGKVTDVQLSYIADLSAKDQGYFDYLPLISNTSGSVNNIVNPGKYYVFTNTPDTQNLPPQCNTGVLEVEISNNKNNIIQTITNQSNGCEFKRIKSGNSSWSQWLSVGGQATSVNIFISESGNDANSGTQAYPFRTFNAALNYARSLQVNGTVSFHFGPATDTWGDITFVGGHNSERLVIYSSDSNNIAKFGNITAANNCSCALNGVKANTITANVNSCITLYGEIYCNALIAYSNSYISTQANLHFTGSTTYAIQVAFGSYLARSSGTISFESNSSYEYFIGCYGNSGYNFGAIAANSISGTLPDKKANLINATVYDSYGNFFGIPGTNGISGTFQCFNYFSSVIPFGQYTYNLGDGSHRWNNVYLHTAPDVDSDSRIKSNVSEIPDAVFEAWETVQFEQFKLNEAIEEKGSEDARFHTGVIAQKIKSAFEAKGLDATKYGLICHDIWEAKDWDETVIDSAAVYDAEGNVVTPEKTHVEHYHTDAGDRWGIRYEELLCMEAAYQRWRVSKLEQRIVALEARS